MSTTAAAQPIPEARETPGQHAPGSFGTRAPPLEAAGRGELSQWRAARSANRGGRGPTPGPWEAACTPDAWLRERL